MVDGVWVTGGIVLVCVFVCVFVYVDVGIIDVPVIVEVGKARVDEGDVLVENVRVTGSSVLVCVDVNDMSVLVFVGVGEEKLVL